jgi:hypothetical protein
VLDPLQHFKQVHNVFVSANHHRHHIANLLGCSSPLFNINHFIYLDATAGKAMMYAFSLSLYKVVRLFAAAAQYKPIREFLINVATYKLSRLIVTVSACVKAVALQSSGRAGPCAKGASP